MKLTQFTPDIFNKIILVYKKVLGAHNRFVVDDALGELKNSGKFIFSQGIIGFTD